MKKKVGLWIDHKKAVIFSLSDDGAEIKRIAKEQEAEMEGLSALKKSKK